MMPSPLRAEDTASNARFLQQGIVLRDLKLRKFVFADTER